MKKHILISFMLEKLHFASWVEKLEAFLSNEGKGDCLWYDPCFASFVKCCPGFEP